MHDGIMAELEREYALRRAENERIEAERRQEISRNHPDIAALSARREQLIFGTLRNILHHTAETEDLPAQMRAISGEIREKLKEKGLPENYLEPVYQCEKCRDTGFVGEPIREMCSCMLKARQKKMREKNGLTQDSRETFENFDMSLFSDEPLPGGSFSQRQLMGLIRKACEEWADTYPKAKTRDLLLTGASGLGKTFLMRSMARRLCERGQDVLLMSAYQMFQIARASYFENEEEPEALILPEILMIDDLGSEPMMQNVTVEQLFLVVNRRQALNRSTVISTNLGLAEFRERYTERVASRMMDTSNCNVLVLQGKDLRNRGRKG